MENARKNKLIGHSLDAKITLFCPDELKIFLEGYKGELSAIFIVSAVDTLPASAVSKEPTALKSDEIEGLFISVSQALGKKCERCWNYNESVGDNNEHLTVCKRCIGNLK